MSTAPARRALLALALALLAPALAQAQEAITSLSDSVVRSVTRSDGTAAVDITNTFVGTLRFEVFGTDWDPVLCTSVAASPTSSTTTTSAGKWTCPVAGFASFRVVSTAWTSGQADVRVGFGPGGGAGSGSGGSGTSFDGVLKDAAGGDDVTDTTNNALRVVGTGTFPVQCSNCSGSGASDVEGSTYTLGTDSVAPLGGYADETSPTAATEDRMSVARLTLQRGLHVNPRDAAGAQLLGTAAAAADGVSNPTLGLVQAINSLYNGSTWDRWRSVTNGQNTAGTGIAAAGILGQYDDLSTGSVTENQFAPARISSRRAQLVEGVTGGTALTVDTELASAAVQSDAASNPTIPNAGAFLSLFNGTTWDRARGDTTNGILSNTELPAAAALANGTANPTTTVVGAMNHVWNGSTWDRMQIPTAACDDPARVTTANVSMTAATGNLEVVALTASQIVYVCGYRLTAGGDADVTWVYGTGTNCATGATTIGTEALSSTAGLSLVVSNGGAVQFKNIASNALCLGRSASVTLKGWVTYVKQ